MAKALIIRGEDDNMEQEDEWPLIAQIKEEPIKSCFVKVEIDPSIGVSSDGSEAGVTLAPEERLECDIEMKVEVDSDSDSTNPLLGPDPIDSDSQESDSSSDDDKPSVNKRILRSTAAVTDISKADEFFTYECVACPEVALKTMLEMNKHFQKHHNSPGYAMCCSVMITPDHFKSHLERHLFPERFTCPHCKVIVPTGSLQLHIRKVHSNIRTCTMCSIS